MLNDSVARLVEYQSDPWRAEPPSGMKQIASAALDLSENRDHFSREARRLAEERYGLDKMTSAYIEVFQPAVKRGEYS